jgi:hypothetical protein
MIQPSLLLSALVDLQYFRPVSRARDAQGNSLTIEDKIEWMVKLYDANYKTRQER